MCLGRRFGLLRTRDGAVERVELGVSFFDEQFKTRGFVVKDRAQTARHFFGVNHEFGGGFHGCLGAGVELFDALGGGTLDVGASGVGFGVLFEHPHHEQDHEEDTSDQKDVGEHGIL